MNTTEISVHWIRKSDQFIHPVTGTVCTVVSHRADPNFTNQRAVRFHNGRGVVAQSFSGSIRVVVK